MSSHSLKKEFKKWVDRPCIIDYEEVKQKTQGIYKPNSVLHYL